MKHSVSSNVWWVNQGSTLKYELENSLIWAPLKGKNEQSQYHWETLKELQRGDIVLNYAQGAIRYVSVVLSPAIKAPKPYEYGDQWGELGRLARLHYYQLEPAIELTKFSNQIRELVIHKGPLDKNGNVKQGYLFYFSEEGLRIIKESQPETEWPQLVLEEKKVNYWVFQSNSRIFDLSGALRQGKLKTFSVNAHKKVIKAGDKVIIWQAGSNPGCYALGTVASEPYEGPDEYFDPDQDTTRCKIYVDINLADNYISREEILANPTLVSLNASRQGTNFRAQPDEYEEILNMAIEKLAANHLSDTSESMKMYTVSDIITHLNNYISSKGYVFSEEFIKNLYLSLKTKPFVILAGISGTGKSKIAQLLAEAVGATAENGRYSLISVRPDWNDSTDLLGYRNLQGEFIPGPLTKVIEAAMEAPQHPYFVCLDEMNLARVEYYFSDFLSVIESREFKEGKITSLPIDLQKSGEEKLYFPENLYVIGTVNMDETTHSFSRKVLDRANTIELMDINLGILPKAAEEIEAIEVTNDYFRSDYLQMKDCVNGNEQFLQEKIEMLEQINRIISACSFQVGYRVRDEFCFYLLYNHQWGLLPEGQAVDFQIMQKILPRIQGSNYQLESVLKGLMEFCKERYPLSYKKLEFMLGRLESDGFTSFWP